MPINNRLLPHTLAAQAAALPADWKQVLDNTTTAHALTLIETYIEARLRAGAIIYPATPFQALTHLPLHQVRVVILGQDPYHGPGQAQGLAFSVPDDYKCPPSLRNIFKEISRDYVLNGTPGHDLSSWAEQGVLLLNTALTVEDGQPGAHTKHGWEIITDALFRAVANDLRPKAFLLWGAHAQAKTALLPNTHPHLVLTANHPSPLSATRAPAPFIGCGHFRRTNDWLATQGQVPIDWTRSFKKSDTPQPPA